MKHFFLFFASVALLAASSLQAQWAQGTSAFASPDEMGTRGFALNGSFLFAGTDDCGLLCCRSSEMATDDECAFSRLVGDFAQGRSPQARDQKTALTMPDSVQAADSLREALSELFQIMNMSSIIDQMLAMQLQLKPELAPIEEAMRDFFDRLWISLEEDFINLYMETFTPGEIRDIVAFHKSPVGQKCIQKMPELMGKIDQMVSQRIEKNGAELERIIMEALRLKEKY